MTPIIATAPIPRITYAPPCPPWCADHVDGGPVTAPTGATVVIEELHEVIVADIPGVDAETLIGKPVVARVLVERCDDPDEYPAVGETRIVVGLRDRDHDTTPVDVADVLAGWRDDTIRLVAALALEGRGSTGKLVALGADAAEALGLALLQAARLAKATDYAPSTPLESAPAGGFVPSAQRAQALHDALNGVELGAHDERILTWLAGWDDSTVRTVVSLILRARAAGGAR